MFCAWSAGWWAGSASPSPLGIWAKSCLGLAAGAAAFAAVGCGARAAALGAVTALLFSVPGYCVWRWSALAEAVRHIGTGFMGVLLTAALPWAWAASLALTAAAVLHPELRGYRVRICLAVSLFWCGSVLSADWWLRGSWDFGPRTLAEAAGLPAAKAEEITAVILQPDFGASSDYGQHRWELRAQEVAGLEASPDNLDRVSRYLESHEHRSLFLRPGMRFLRQGWLLRWDADKALDAAVRGIPGLAAPDYLTALALLRAGPLTPERWAGLERLQAYALQVRDGFEDVNRSQLIFEAFSAAFARFGDEARAQYWLLRVDNLWPINDKKIEVFRPESLRYGAVSGRLILDGRPASSVRVGLFLDTTSEVTKQTSSWLSGSALPDSRGRFWFEHLGPGSYHLELAGTREQLRGRILGSPGPIDISEHSPARELAAIRIERGRPARPEPEAAARDWLRAESQSWGELFRPRMKR
jgi:hypothetical protein